MNEKVQNIVEKLERFKQSGEKVPEGLKQEYESITGSDLNVDDLAGAINSLKLYRASSKVESAAGQEKPVSEVEEPLETPVFQQESSPPPSDDFQEPSPAKASVSVPGVPSIGKIPGAGNIRKGLLKKFMSGKLGTKIASILGKAKSKIALFAGKIAAKLGLSSFAAVLSGGTSLLIQAAIELGLRLLRAIKTNVSKYAKYFVYAAMGLLLLSYFVPAAIIPAALSGGVAFASGGMGAFSAGASGILSGITAIINITLEVMVLPIVIFLVVTPLLLAFIIFVITSGGYIVPPGNAVPFSEGVGGEYPNCWPTYGRISQGTPGTTICRDSVTGEIVACSHVVYGLNAIDIAWMRGSYIHATHDGVATLSSGGGYGDYVVIKSPHGFSTLYSHMLEIYVGTGKQVKAGEVIGTMNGDPSLDTNPGNSTATHLHYELRDSPLSVNNIVPDYTVGGMTSGCFASDAGGVSEPPIPGVPEPKTPGSTPPPLPGGSGVPLPTPATGVPASCSEARGVCKPADDPSCIPYNLPEGASRWDCPVDMPQCCSALSAG